MSSCRAPHVVFLEQRTRLWYDHGEARSSKAISNNEINIQKGNLERSQGIQEKRSIPTPFLLSLPT